MPLRFFFLCAATLLGPCTAWGANDCVFQARSGLAILFDDLDPSKQSDVKMALSTSSVGQFAGNCAGNNEFMNIAIKDGLTTRQLKKGLTASITYTLSGFPIGPLAKPGKDGWTNWMAGRTIEARIAWSAFADAPAGDYMDSVTLELTP